MTTALGSVKNSRLKLPPSRPQPESAKPPKGARRSRMKKQFVQIVPARSCAATRCARDRFSVNTIALRPYGESLAACTASSSESNGVTVTTGPNTSSRTIAESAGASTTTVGLHDPAVAQPAGEDLAARRAFST